MTIDIYAGNTTTTGIIAPGNTISSYIDTAGDSDWFRVSMSWGTGYQFKLDGGYDWGPPGSPEYYLDWPKLTLRGPSGEWLAEVEWSPYIPGVGVTIFMALDWPPRESGDYFIEVSSQYSGDLGLYWLSLATFVPQARQVTGTTGNDSLEGGYAPEILRGLAGDDTLSDDITWGGEATTNRVGDTLEGGDGNDLLLSGGAGAAQGWQDWIDGGAGEDTARIDFGWCTGPVAFQPVVAGSGYTVVGVEVFAVLGSPGGDTLAGLGGDDLLDGGAGKDWLDGQGGSDTLIGGDGIDTVTYAAAAGAVSVVLGADGKGTAAGAFGNDNLDGIEHVVGGSGADLLRVTGGSGGYWLDSGAGDDTLAGADGRDSLIGGAGRDSLWGGAGDDSLLGGVDDDTLSGGDGADLLEGGAGADSLAGGGGDDHYRVETRDDVVLEAPGGGRDHVDAPFSLTLAADLESVALTGTRALNANGNAADNWLGGNAAANRLAGFAGNDGIAGAEGADTLLGGSGDDTLWGGAGDDSLFGGLDDDTLDGGGGADWLEGGIGDDSLSGGHHYSSTTLLGGDGADTLEGGYLWDSLIGGGGDDFYWVDRLRISPEGADRVIEAPGGGHDRVMTNDSHTLAPEVEDLELFAIYATTGTGNALANHIIGNRAANRLDGRDGDDTLVGDSETRFWGDDTLIGGLGNDSLAGTLGNDTLDGGAGNDRLDGGSGADSMAGGLDDDTYVVDDTGDVVKEVASAGLDQVLAYIDSILAPNVETLTLLGTAVNGTGNVVNNVLTGTALANTLLGLAGNDTLEGGDGADTLDGGLGADSMVGGSGNDVYLVGSAFDRVVELSGGGTDRVISTASLNLAAEVENLTLGGEAALNANGNALDNAITGTTAANRLNGGPGNDTVSGLDGDDVLLGAAGTDSLLGGGGNDTLDGGLGTDTLVGGTDNDLYVVNATTDVVRELAGQGIDTVQAAATFTLGLNVEHLELTGAAAIDGSGNGWANRIIGNGAANRLDGGSGHDTLSGAGGGDTLFGGIANDVLDGGDGDDVLVGGAWADTLTGGAGADAFRFGTSTEGIDRITDFTPGLDRIEVSAAGFGGLLPLGVLDAGNFSASGVAVGAAPQFVYVAATGVLRWDADGAGGTASVAIALIQGAPSLSAADIVVIA